MIVQIYSIIFKIGKNVLQKRDKKNPRLTPRIIFEKNLINL